MPGPKYMEASSKEDANRQEIERLEQEAGIADGHRKSLDLAGPMFPSFSDAPEGTEQYREETAKFEREYEESIARHRDLITRHAYFSIQDIDLRKKLISAHRNQKSLAENTQWHAVIEATEELRNAPYTNKYWPLHAAVIGVMITILGHFAIGEGGGIAGAVVAYFIGRFMEEECKRERAKNVELARGQLAECEGFYRDAQNSPQLFSMREERTGERDADR